MTVKPWSGVPYLDALRPDYGWEVKFALISTYSLDLRAMVAALLALGAVDDDRGSGSKVDFANAIESLENKFRIVCQKGRIIAPKKRQKILALMDQFVREVSFDESERSWHPKAALVKTVSSSGEQVQWRLWIGSRNLTRDTSWDVGLVVVGELRGDNTISGIADLGFELAQRADLKGVEPEQVRKELKQVSWGLPAGCDLKELTLHTERVPRALPPPPHQLKRLLVISPFVDGGLIRELGSWGTNETHRTLLTTQMELCKLIKQTKEPLKQFADLLVLDSPEFEVGEEDETNSDEEPEARGLHAKIILAEHSNGHSMWIGSANATSRGWYGPNAEVIAKVSPSKNLAAGLIEFTRVTASAVSIDSIPESGDEEDESIALEHARKVVSSSWELRLTQGADSEWHLQADRSPTEGLDGIQLGFCALNGNWVDWELGRNSISLGQIKTGDESELLYCRVEQKGEEMSWLQRVPMTPAPGKERDHMALSRYLDSRTFLQWIRSLLHGTTGGDGGGEWDESKAKHSKDAKRNGPEWWCPTLEEVLKAWSKNPGSIREVDRKISFYFELMNQRPANDTVSEDHKILEEFVATWQVVKRSLGGPR